MKIAAPLPPDQIAAMLRSLTDVSVVVVGDFGFDAYLHLETLPGETSQETGRPIEAVRRFAYDPAGAANVAVNLVALGVRDVRAVGVVGDDLHGRELVRALGMRGIDTSGFVTQTGGWQTVVYAKPHRDGIEGTRIDFGEFNELGAETNAEMLRRFREALRGEPAVIFNQQVRRGVLEPSNIVDFVGAAAGAVTIADSRHHARAFDGCRLKLNAREAARFLGEAEPSPNGDPEHAAALAERLYAQEKRPVFVTCGKMGMAVRDGTVAAFVPGVIAPEPVDEVGAGDTAVAALAAATRAGYAPVEAAGFANLAAAVTVSKVGQTGTASREEITALAEQARYRSIP